jgi:6-phosphogluconolactonase (cycloisomerase 2 family)
MISLSVRFGLQGRSRALHAIVSVVLAGLASLLTACGGGGGGGGSPPPAATLSSITVGPASASVVAGHTLQFTATGSYSDGTQKDVSASVTWTSGTTSIATISATGLAAGVAAGTSSISAALNGVTGQDMLTVTPIITLSSITVGPASASVVAGLTLQFTAVGVYSDGSQKDLAASVTWASATTSVATISAAGVATGVAAGTSSVSASLNGVTGKDVLTVTPATLTSLVISPGNPSIPVHRTQQFKATGTYTDNSTKDLTNTVTWTSSNPSAATISTAPNPGGLATAVALGTTMIGASIPGGAAATPAKMTVTSTVHVYATNFDGDTVSQYVVGSNGSLTALSTPSIAAGHQPFSVSVEPSGEFVYVSNWGSSTVSQYVIGADGTLSPVGASGTVASGLDPNNVTIDHADRFAYVANLGENTVSQYKIGNDGALIPMSTPKVTAGTNPASVTVDLMNRFAYVTNFGSATQNPPAGPSTISQYSIGSDGSLTALSTPTVASGSGPGSLVIDPSGKYVYVTNVGDNTVGQYVVNADGSLSAMTAPTVPTAARPISVVVDPTGKYVYVANQNDNSISQYTIGTGGALAAMTPAKVTSDMAGVSAVTIDPTGQFLYAANRGAMTISQFTIGPTGGLTAMTTSSVAAGTHPTAIATGY